MEKRASKCAADEIPYTAGLPVVGSLSFKSLTIIIGWVCFGLTVLLWLALIIPHLFRYKSPNEQRQIFRITLTPLVYSLFGLISLQAYHAAPYLEPIPKLYEACALASLFLLYVNYVAPEARTQEEFFHDLDFVVKGQRQPGKGLRWFRVSYGFFQSSKGIRLTTDSDAGGPSSFMCLSMPFSSLCKKFSLRPSGTAASRRKLGLAAYVYGLMAWTNCGMLTCLDHGN